MLDVNKTLKHLIKHAENFGDDSAVAIANFLLFRLDLVPGDPQDLVQQQLDTSTRSNSTENGSVPEGYQGSCGKGILWTVWLRSIWQPEQPDSLNSVFGQFGEPMAVVWRPLSAFFHKIGPILRCK